MKYVFFDIECASVTKVAAKICAFGYVVTDEQFHILEQEDIRINPKGGFHLMDRKGQRGIVLPYDYALFKTCPTFDKVYPRIKALLEGKDTLVFGHAVMNDVKYLCLETKRFQLPSFEFRFADTQLLYMTRENAFSNQPGLETVIEKLDVKLDDEFRQHRAMDDAYATMQVAKALASELSTDLTGVCQQYKMTLGSIKRYDYVAPVTEAERIKRQEAEQKKAERGMKRDKFYHTVYKRRPKMKGGTLQGKYFCFARRMEEEEESIELLEYIFANGGKYVTDLSLCNVFVSKENEGGERIKQVEKRGDVLLLRPEEVTKL